MIGVLGVEGSYGEDFVRFCRPGDRRLAITFLEKERYSISEEVLLFKITNVSRVSMSQLQLKLSIFDGITHRHVATFDLGTKDLRSGQETRFIWGYRDQYGAYVHPGFYRFVAHGTFLDSPRGPFQDRTGKACGDTTVRLNP